MSRYYPSCLLVLIICLFFNAHPVSAQYKNRKSDPHAPGEDIYKHFTGKIGGRNIVIDLLYGYQGSSNYGGSNFYFTDSPGTRKFIIQEPATFDHGVPLKATEWPEYHSIGDEMDELKSYKEHPQPQWNFTIADHKLEGTYQKTGSAELQSFTLNEDYRQSTPMDLFVFHDSIQINHNNTKNWITTYGCFVIPAGRHNRTDSTFISNMLLRFIHGKKLPQTKLPAKQFARKYFDFFAENWLKQYQSNQPDATMPDFFSVNILPVYNENKILIFKATISTGLRNNHVSYFSLDVQHHKVLEPSAIVKLRSRKLNDLLEAALKNQYNIDIENTENNNLVTNSLSVPRQVRITNGGLIFTYNPGELAKDQVIDLFISGDDLGKLLKRSVRKILMK